MLKPLVLRFCELSKLERRDALDNSLERFRSDHWWTLPMNGWKHCGTHLILLVADYPLLAFRVGFCVSLRDNNHEIGRNVINIRLKVMTG